MTTLTTPQRVIIFGGSNAKRIVPFLLKLTKGKGIRVEDRTVSGHSLEDLENFPKNTEVREKDFNTKTIWKSQGKAEGSKMS